MVRFLETNRIKFSTGILGVFPRSTGCAAAQDWKTGRIGMPSWPTSRATPRKGKPVNPTCPFLRSFSRRHVVSSSAATWHVRQGELDLSTDASGEPVVECLGGTLVCLSKGDSARVRDVKGQFKLLEGRFYGSEGRVEWERTTNEGDLSAELGAFEVRMKEALSQRKRPAFEAPCLTCPWKAYSA